MTRNKLSNAQTGEVYRVPFICETAMRLYSTGQFNHDGAVRDATMLWDAICDHFEREAEKK